MKRYFWLCFSLSLLCCKPFGLEAQDDPAFLKHSIKSNVFQWIMNEPNLIYEYRFSKKFGLESTLGTYGIYNRDIHTNLDFTEPLPQKGIVLRINPKFYFNSLNLKRSEYYFSPMLLFKYHEAKGSWNSISTSVDKTEKRFIVGPSVLLGYQSVMENRLIFDFYCGGGLRYRHISETIFASQSSQGPLYDPRLLPKTYTFGKWAPSIHLGLKIGFGFSADGNTIRTADKNDIKSAQEKDIKPFYKYTINTQPVKYFEYWQEQNIGFEYRFSRGFGLEASVGGYLVKGRHPFVRINDTLSKNLKIYLRPKFYLDSPIESINLPFYISPLFVYGKTESHGNNLKYTSDFLMPGLLVGYQPNIKHIVLDVYTGFGMNYFTTHAVSRLSGYLYDKTYSGRNPIFQLGLKLGYGFKPVN